MPVKDHSQHFPPGTHRGQVGYRCLNQGHSHGAHSLQGPGRAAGGGNGWGALSYCKNESLQVDDRMPGEAVEGCAQTSGLE